MYKYLFTVLGERIRVSILDADSNFSCDAGEIEKLKYKKLFTVLDKRRRIKELQYDGDLIDLPNVVVSSKLDHLTFTGFVRQLIKKL
jgi:hypothetical protein